MFARLVKAHMKPGKFELATRRMEEKVIPLLQQQRGFRDELSFFDEDHEESIAISFWDSEADIRKYENDVYPDLARSLSDTYEGKPEVRHFEVANSTWYKIHAT
jgi:heme-degrading monooxygenase HmoA